MTPRIERIDLGPRPPEVREFAASYPTFESFRDENSPEIDVFQTLVDDLHILDFVFALLGIATAFGLVRNATDRDEAEVRNANYAERRQRARGEADDK